MTKKAAPTTTEPVVPAEPGIEALQLKAAPNVPIKKIPLKLVKPDGENRDVPRSDVEDLVASFGQVGQLQPIAVIEKGDKFRLIFGHRRTVAAGVVGWSEIAALVYKEGSLTEDQVHAMRAVENIQRDDLNPIELFELFASLIGKKFTQQQIGDLTGWSVKKIREIMELGRLGADVRPFVASGRIPLKHAFLLTLVGDLGRQWELAKGVMGCTYGCKKDEIGQGDYVEPLYRLRQSIGNAARTLGGPRWPLDQDFNKCRACVGCPNNTASRPGLFEEISNLPGKSAKGNCTNKDCYEGKTKAWTKHKEREAEKAAKEAEKAAKEGRDVPEATKKKAKKAKDPNADRVRIPAETLYQKSVYVFGQNIAKAIRAAMPSGKKHKAADALALIHLALSAVMQGSSYGVSGKKPWDDKKKVLALVADPHGDLSITEQGYRSMQDWALEYWDRGVNDMMYFGYTMNNLSVLQALAERYGVDMMLPLFPEEDAFKAAGSDPLFVDSIKCRLCGKPMAKILDGKGNHFVRPDVCCTCALKHIVNGELKLPDAKPELTAAEVDAAV